MLIDDYMPAFDVSEHHHVQVRATRAEVYAQVRKFDMSDAKLTRLLVRLRGLPAPQRFAFDDLLKMRFCLLAERRGEEIVLGLVGRFWQPCGEICRMDEKTFRNFAESGYAKAAWNFHLTPEAKDAVRLTTETRVQCTDAASRFKFRLYWSFISSFSALIRKEMLQTLKRNAERQSHVGVRPHPRTV